MYHSSNGYTQQFAASDNHEKQRWNESTQTYSSNLSLPNGWSDKNQSGLHQLATSVHVALMNVRRFAGQYWQARTNRSPISGSKPLTTRDSGFSTPVFVLLCGLWYTTSALSSNTGKVILGQFRYPITLTFIQFGFVAGYCLLFMTPLIRFSRLRTPTRAIVQNTLPMGLFQVGGHMFSSMAISRIPVSTVHTIKALSPLFTVAAYALLFGVSYSSKTYISLLPLTIGVMLACSFDVASDVIGLTCAFGSAIVFVSSNIFFKKIMPTNSSSSSASFHKMDKLNLLLYSSGMAFLLMIPLWLYYDLPLLLAAQAHPEHISHPKQGHTAPHSVTYYFIMNGTVHFAQNIIAFIILSSTSPVTYSIASLIKRVAVICIAIAWFNQVVHPVQALGIVLTFAGLYMYKNAKGDVEKGEKKMTRVQAARDLMLPTTKSESRLFSGTETPPNEYASSYVQPEHPPIVSSSPNGSAYARPRGKSILSSGTAVHHAGRQHYRPPISPTTSFSSHGASEPRPIKLPRKESISLRIVSPIDPYPSPPPSLDSPTSHTIPLPDNFLKAHELGQRVDPAMA